jgi:hydroxymethylbilane synthase
MNNSTPEIKLRLGTRGSLLARVQSQLVADELERAHPGLRVELIIFRTTGDRVQDRPLHAEGGKGLFTRELEEALLAGRIDLAVHSFKDVPVTMPLVDQSGLAIAAVPRREDPRDVLISLEGRTLADLPQGARVGTGSLRRRSMLLSIRPDLVVELIRGNIDTRLRKLRDGQFDAIVLAMAGVRRAGLFDASQMVALEIDQMLPSAGQGALALQCRRGDRRTRTLLEALNDPDTAQCVQAERAIVQMFNGDCHSPIGVYATISNEQLTVRAAIGARDGNPPVVSAEAQASTGASERALRHLFRVLCHQGAQELLSGSSSPVHTPGAARRHASLA